MTVLRIALTTAQLAAASRLHSRLSDWDATDEALAAVAVRFPKFDFNSCLVKAAIVNQLYYTNVFALTTVARHVAGVMAAGGDDLVESLAAVNIDGKTIRFLSFASKFAHFFVDERYAIYDSYAVRSIRHHLTGAALPYDDPPRYADYSEALRDLAVLSRVTCSPRELDRYLWLVGLYRAWMRHKKARINGEVSKLFAMRDSEPAVGADLLILAGAEEL